MAEAVCCDGTTANLPVGACGIRSGVGLAAEIWQQDDEVGASAIEGEESCPAIMGQCGTHFSAAGMCIQQKDRADAGITSVVSATIAATYFQPRPISTRDPTKRSYLKAVIEVTLRPPRSRH